MPTREMDERNASCLHIISTCSLLAHAISYITQFDGTSNKAYATENNVTVMAYPSAVMFVCCSKSSPVSALSTLELPIFPLSRKLSR